MVHKKAFNLKYSKFENYPVKSYRNIKSKNSFNIDEDMNIESDKNIIYNNFDNGKNNMNKKGNKDRSIDNSINNNLNKIILESQKENIKKETHKYNPKKQINKSKSYFSETNNLNKNKNHCIYLNDSKEKYIDFSYNNKDNSNNINNAKAYNYKKNVNYFNQKKRIIKGKNKNGFKHKIYYDLENNEKKDITNNSSDYSFDSIDIDDFVNQVNYNGDKTYFPKYIEELKLKADITNIVQNMFKNEINSYDGLDKMIENHSKKKCKKILDMYKFLLERLIQINQNKINDKDINSFYEEIYSSK